FKLQAGLRIGFFAAELQHRIAKQAVRVRVLGIELNCFAEFLYRWLWKVGHGISAPEQHMQGSGISHLRSQTLEPLLAILDTLGLEVGHAQKVSSLKIVVQVQRCL